MKVTTVDGLTAVRGGNIQSAGEICWWGLGGTLDLAKLREDWKMTGLPVEWLPAPPGRPTAIRRAVHEHANTTTIVKGIVGGYAILKERSLDGGRDVEYTTSRKVLVDRGGMMTIDPPGPSFLGALEERTSHFENNLTNGDISAWLTDLVDRMAATPLRPSGGVYFVPAYSTNALARACAAIERAAPGVRVYRVSAVQNEEAARAFLDAISHEVNSEVETITRTVAEATLGDRGLQNRIARAEVLRSKLNDYEELLGARLDGVHANLAELCNALVGAVAKLHADEDAAAQ